MPKPEPKKKTAKELAAYPQIREADQADCDCNGNINPLDEKNSADVGSTSDRDGSNQAAGNARVNLRKDSSNVYSMVLLLALLLISSCFPSYINLGHAILLERLSRLTANPVFQLYLSSDLIKAFDSANLPSLALAESEKMVTRCASSKTFNADHLAFANLLLAKRLLTSHEEARARSLISSSLVEIKNPKSVYPDELGALLCDLANYFANQGDRQLASVLFAKSADYWNKVCCRASSYSKGAPNTGHKCYMLLDAAANCEALGDLRGAAMYTKQAVESAEHDEHWDKTEGQIDRLGRLAHYYNRLGSYAEAEYTAKKALDIPMDDLSNPFRKAAQDEFESARQAQHLDSPGSHTTAGPGKVQ